MRKLIKKILKENDFDWAKESNPIQCKDLKGYYFYHGGDTRKFMIDDVGTKLPKGYVTDDLKVHYTWWDSHSDDFDWNQMNCDTFIHRVKLGDYRLYDKNGNVIEPRNLAYTDNTFGDDERKEIWEQDESDDLQWIRDVVDYDFQPRAGDYIEVINLGSEYDFLTWLGDYSDDYLEGNYGNTIKGVTFHIGGNSFGLVEEKTGDDINFPNIDSMPVYKNGGEFGEYERLNLMYKLLKPL